MTNDEQETRKEEEGTAVLTRIDENTGTAIPTNAMPTLNAPSTGNGATETTTAPKLEVLDNVIIIFRGFHLFVHL
jgi:hypothetical protein